MKKSLSEGALRPSDLLAHFKQTDATTRIQIWAAEVVDNTVELIREMVYTHTMVQPSPHGNEQTDVPVQLSPDILMNCSWTYHAYYSIVHAVHYTQWY